MPTPAEKTQAKLERKLRRQAKREVRTAEQQAHTDACETKFQELLTAEQGGE